MAKPKLEKRTCECGCGETFKSLPSSRRRFINNTHVQRALTAASPNPMREVTCACGCGTRFQTKNAKKRYVHPTHAKSFHNKQTAGSARAELPPEERTRSFEITRLNGVNGKLVRENEELLKQLDKFSTIRAADLRVPKWVTEMPAGKKNGKHHAIPVLMLSDLHLDEVVDLHAMDGINEYSREIAEARFHRVVEGLVLLLKRYVSGVEWDGLFLAMLGDIITGIIHAELERTNEAPVPVTIAHWVPIIASGITYLADELDVPIHVACVDGNHDRSYGKTPSKQRATSSWAWVIYNWLADHLRDDPRITFTLTSSQEQIVPVYNTRLLLSHGDSFRSQGGVGGLYPSMLKWLLRRHQMYSQTKQDFDYALIGHWHQTLYGQDFFVNGSLKGYDEYAKGLGFTFERPQQTLFLVTPERGVVQRLSVHAD